MKITIEATDTITTIGGVPVRLWEGVTEAGTRCQVFVHRIGVVGESEDLERELITLPKPREVEMAELVIQRLQAEMN